MRLSYANRRRAVDLYNSTGPCKNKREVVTKVLDDENIFISGRGLWNLIARFRRTASVANLSLVTRDARNTSNNKVTLRQLNLIEGLLREDRGITSASIKR